MMSPQRRQTRASATSNSMVTSSRRGCRGSEDSIPMPRTRSGQSKSNPPSPSKSSQPNHGSPSKRKSLSTTKASPPSKNLLKPSSPKKASPKAADKSTKTLTSVKNIALKSASKAVETVLKIKDDKPAQLTTSLRSSPRKSSSKIVTTPVGLKSTEKNKMSSRGATLNKSPSSPRKEVAKMSPLKTASSKLNSATRQTPKSSPTAKSCSSRKRLLPSPSQSPRAAKTMRLCGNVVAPFQIKTEDSDDDCVILDDTKWEETEQTGVQENLGDKKPGVALPSDPELSGRFLRRKWFSLKARGGFTCLRSAILSPEEIAKEVIQHTNVDTPQDQDSNFFTTKLMVRLSSRLPPARARPSCEELVDLINSKQTGPKIEPQTEQKGEGTAIRVKVERRSFIDTISHINSKPVKAIDKAGTSGPDPKSEIVKQKGNLTKKQEQEIALHQLKNLSVPEEESSQTSKAGTASSTRQEIIDRCSGRRWFSLKSRGTFTSLRSAILSPEELSEEFMKRTNVASPTCMSVNSTGRHDSRVGPSRARVSTEDLVGLLNSKQMRKNFESLIEHKGEDGAVHLKVPNDPRKREQEMALQQLDHLRYWVCLGLPERPGLKGLQDNVIQSLCKSSEVSVPLRVRVER